MTHDRKEASRPPVQGKIVLWTNGPAQAGRRFQAAKRNARGGTFRAGRRRPEAAAEAGSRSPGGSGQLMLTMRSMGRRAFRATSGGTFTSKTSFSSECRSFSRVIIFMYLHSISSLTGK